MSINLGAVSAAANIFKSHASTKGASTSRSGFNDVASSAAAGSATQAKSSSPIIPYSLPGNGVASISAETIGALISAQSESSGSGATNSATASSNDLLTQSDVNGDDQVSESKSDHLGSQKLGAARDKDVFGKLDANHDGVISASELAAAVVHTPNQSSKDDDSHDRAVNRPKVDPATKANTDAAHADGLKDTAKSPVTSAGSGTASYNRVEGLIARQAQAINSSVSAPLSITV
jgi:EF hand domain-containing protein